jgi:hypothetical protein
LAAFHTLRLVDLSENEGLGGGLDGRLLPAQVVQVSARSCALRAVGNFSREQLATLKMLDLAGTPLQCQCPVQPELIDVLRRQPDIYVNDEFQ